MEVDAAAPVAPFVQQLFKLVHEGLHVTWAADGAALVIPDTRRFAATNPQGAAGTREIMG